jgi:signal transduction histidine kinase/DNA-binding response OmpR family regulator
MLRAFKVAILSFLLFPVVSAVSQPAVDSIRHLLSAGTLKPEEKIDALNKLAALVRLATPEESFSFATEAQNASETIGYERGVCDALNTLALYYWLKALPEKGLDVALQALTKSVAIDHREGMMNANLVLGILFKDLGERDKAQEFTNHGLDLALALDHREGISRAYNALGNYARMQGKPQEALRLYKTGLSYLDEENYSHGEDVIISLLLNNIARYYIEIDQERALTKQYLEKSLRIATAFKNKTGELQTRVRMGELLMNSGSYRLAEAQFDICEKLCIELSYPGALMEVFKDRAILKKKEGDPVKAQLYELNYLRLKDSLFNEEKTREIARLESRYETQKKDQTIRLLQQEKDLQRIWQAISVAAVVVLMAVVFFIYRLQHARALRARQLLETEKVLNLKLKEMDKLKSGFFANISHEFRTPLSLILAPIENELKRKLSPESKESMALIRRNANRLLDLVNQLLDLSKLEFGKMELRVQQTHLRQLISLITASFESLLTNKNIILIKNIEIPDCLYWCDQDKLEKIITNLLSNAFKFTPTRGTVTLTTVIEEDSYLSVTVTDTGNGIPADEQSSIFLPFYQVRQDHHVQPGTGLGLPLVKELTRLHQGTVHVFSEPGKGASFVVRIPVVKRLFAEEQLIVDHERAWNHTVAVDSSALNGQPEGDIVFQDRDAILVADDHAELREFISGALQRKGYAVLTAVNGKDAAELAIKFIPSLVLSDLMMPEMDGLSLTKKLKEDERTSHIPVILLTAKNEQQSKVDGWKTGADDYLIKPFSPDELLARISNLIEQRKRLSRKFAERVLVLPPMAGVQSLDDKFLARAHAVVEANLEDYTFTVERMAEEMNLSRTQLLRKLKALTDLSPNDFIKNIRLKRAAHLIRQKADTITQIGYAVGFNDQSYFSKCFKKQFGVTPSEFALDENRSS